jgi:CRP-like cAMP-binding protein
MRGPMSSRFLFGAYGTAPASRPSPSVAAHSGFDALDLPVLPPPVTTNAELDPQGDLRAVPTLAELPRQALAELASLSASRREAVGALLSEQGSTATRMDILVRGAIKIVRTTQHSLDETSVVLDVARGPAIVPTLSLFDGQPELGSIVTLRASQLVSVERRVVLRMAAQHPSFARALFAYLAQTARRHVQRVDEVASGPVDDRVRHLLEDLAAQHGTAFGQGRFIAIPLRRKDIACMVNATTETVSRVLARFEREGLTRSTRDGIWLRATSGAPDANLARFSQRR